MIQENVTKVSEDLEAAGGCHRRFFTPSNGLLARRKRPIQRELPNKPNWNTNQAIAISYTSSLRRRKGVDQRQDQSNDRPCAFPAAKESTRAAGVVLIPLSP